MERASLLSSNAGRHKGSDMAELKQPCPKCGGSSWINHMEGRRTRSSSPDYLNAEGGRRSVRGTILLILDGNPLARLEGTPRRPLCGDFGLGGQPKDIIEQPLLGAHHDIPPIPIQLNDLPPPLLHVAVAEPWYRARPRPKEKTRQQQRYRPSHARIIAATARSAKVGFEDQVMDRSP